MTSSPNHRLLMLDVDESMIHASTERLAHEPDFCLVPYYVYQRPFLNEFLETCRESYRLAIWSSASADYVQAIIDQIIPKSIDLAFIWARDRCTRRFDPELQEEFYLKNLKKIERLGYCLDRVLIVEDEPRKVQANYGNAVYVRPFLGSRSDDDLRLLAKYLPGLSSATNVRDIEKRNWRSQLA